MLHTSELNSILTTTFIGISILWLASEIVLAKFKNLLQADERKNYDDSTLKHLWVVISISVSIGVLVRFTNFGEIPVPDQSSRILGLTLIVLGLVIRWIAILTLKKYFTVNVTIFRNHQIIQTGLYHHIRHPSYLGSLLSFLGLGVALSNWVSTLVIIIPITAIFLRRIRVEEAVLEKTFGTSYAEYCKQTWRLLPKIY